MITWHDLVHLPQLERLPALCPDCKGPVSPEPALLSALERRYGDLLELPLEEEASFFRAPGCSHCQGTGHRGDVAAFDVFYAAPDAGDAFDQPSLLPLEAYIWGLAQEGHLALEELLQWEADQLRSTYNLLSASERALGEAKATLEGKLLELEAANRVLQQRTEALISLQGVSQALISVIDLHELAQRVCRHTRDLCGADRTVLYLHRSGDRAEVLAAHGWGEERVPDEVATAEGFSPGLAGQDEPRPYPHWPPGIPPRHPDVEGAYLRAGLRVPLVAQDRLVGVMIVHSTERAAFAPGEVALLQTLAQQAALAIQRAEMIEGLGAKERIERELELGEPGMFATVFYGVIDRLAARLTYARAGHDPPPLLRGCTARRLGGVGTLLGIAGLDEVTLSEEQVDLAPGDRLVLYTDGLTDAAGAVGEIFDLDQLVALLQSHAGLPGEELCGVVFDELTALQGGALQYDDMTLLVVDVGGGGSSSP